MPAWQQVRDVPHGVAQRLEYESKSINKAREAIVYLPPGYDSGTDRYPVVYLLHGAGGDESVWLQRMQAADSINELNMLWIGCGTEDSRFDVNHLFSEQLTEAGVEHTFRNTPGAHTPAVWSRYLYEVAPQLFQR